MLKLSYIAVWVHDQDEALKFYTEKLGFELREDVTLPELAGYRWLTVGPVGQPDISVSLNVVPDPPVFEPETGARIRELMGKGVIGGLILNTDDFDATFDELKARGVEFSEEPSERPYGKDAAIRDPSGNSIRLVQPVPLPAS